MKALRWMFAALAVGFLIFSGGAAQAQQSVRPCWYNSADVCVFVSAADPLPVNASVSVSASITGFPTTQSTGTPINVTTGGVTGTLPTGAVVVASNVGATNGAYCKLGASATTSDQLIPPNSWFAFTVGVATQLTCITSTSTTTVNMVGGSGLPTGSGGGGGGSGGGGAITIASGAVASGAYSSGSIASGAYASGSIGSGAYASGSIGSGAIASGAIASGAVASGAYASGSIGSGAMVDLGAIADAAATAGSTGTVSAKLRLMTTQLGTINTTLGSPFQAGGSIGNTTFAVTQATSSSLKAQVDPLTAASWGLGTFGSAIGTVGYNLGAYDGTNLIRLKGDETSGLWVNIKAGAGSGGTALADGATFTEGTTNFTPIGGEYVSGGGANCTTAKGCTIQMTIDRMAYVNIGKVGGAATGTAGSAGTGVLTVQGIASMTPVQVSQATAASLNGTMTRLAGSATTMQNGATANGNGINLTVTGYETALVNVNCSVSCSGGTTINFEGTDSTGTFFSIAAFPVAGSSTAVTTATTTGQFNVPVAGLTSLRARISAYSAGTITVTGTPMYGSTAHLVQVANSNANGQAVAASSSPVTLASDKNVSVTAYPIGATAITASATGTTGATTATLAGTSGKTTYICGYSIRANATAAATVTNTVTGVITATLSSIMWIAPLASGIGVDEQIFSPCIPASGTNQAIAVVSGAPGSGGTVSSRGWGYQL